MSDKPIAMRDAFLERLWRAMHQREDLFFTCADFGSPVLDKIRADFPKRFVNVGIAEQNLINVSAGLALEGWTVFAYAIAPFITMRCYEQIRVSLALLSEVRSMNVNLIGVGAGYSYVVSGPTHQCYEDLTLMRAMPNFRVLSPCDHVSAAGLFDTCINHGGPKYLRFDAQVLPQIHAECPISNGLGYQNLRTGGSVLLIATGYMVHTALQVAAHLAQTRQMHLSVLDLYDLSHFDAEGLLTIMRSHEAMVSLEEGFSGRGGLDALLFDLKARQRLATPLLNLGVEGGYRYELGTRAQLHEQVGIGANVAAQRIFEFAQPYYADHDHKQKELV